MTLSACDAPTVSTANSKKRGRTPKTQTDIKSQCNTASTFGQLRFSNISAEALSHLSKNARARTESEVLADVICEVEKFAKDQEKVGNKRLQKIMSEVNNKQVLDRLTWLQERIAAIDASGNVRQMNTIMQSWVPVLYRLFLVCPKLQRSKDR